MAFGWRDRVSPHCTKAQFIRKVRVVRQESGEQVLGKCVHGNALPVDDLPQTTEGTTWTYEERERTTLELCCPSYQIAGLSQAWWTGGWWVSKGIQSKWERNLSGAYRWDDWGGRWEGKQAARPHGLWQSLSSLVAAQMSALRLHRMSVGGSDAGWPVLGKGVGDTAEASLQIFLQA